MILVAPFCAFPSSPIFLLEVQCPVLYIPIVATLPNVALGLYRAILIAVVNLFLNDPWQFAFSTLVTCQVDIFISFHPPCSQPPSLLWFFTNISDSWFFWGCNGLCFTLIDIELHLPFGGPVSLFGEVLFGAPHSLLWFFITLNSLMSFKNLEAWLSS